MAETTQPITIWVELTEAEVVDACKHSCGVPGLVKAGTKMAFIPLVILLIYCVWRLDDIGLGDPTSVACLVLLIIIVLTVFGLGIFKRVGFIEYRYIAHRFYQDPIIYAIGQEGITVSSYQGNDRLPWQNVRSALETPDMFVVTTVRDTVLPIPKRCFENNSDLANANSHLRAFAPVFAISAGAKSPMRVSPRR
jgi:hypothetical protein